MSYERPLKSTLLAELSSPTSVIHILIGPRQGGKNTIARQIQESIALSTIYVTADSPVLLDAAWIETLRGRCSWAVRASLWRNFSARMQARGCYLKLRANDEFAPGRK